MTVEDLKALLAEHSAVRIALEGSTGGYACPLANVAKSLGVDKFELHQLIGSGIDVAGVRVTTEADSLGGDLLFCRTRANLERRANQSKAGGSSSLPGRGSRRNDGEPAPAHVRESFEKGRRDAATEAAYRRGRGQQPGPEGQEDLVASRAGGSGRNAKSAGPFAERVEREELDAQSGREWEASAELRAEFPDFAAFAAFRRAEARGEARIFGAGTVVKGEPPVRSAE